MNLPSELVDIVAITASVKSKLRPDDVETGSARADLVAGIPSNAKITRPIPNL